MEGVTMTHKHKWVRDPTKTDADLPKSFPRVANIKHTFFHCKCGMVTVRGVPIVKGVQNG